MAATVIDRAVLELGVDGSKLFREATLQIREFSARVKTALGKDLKTAFSGIEDAVGGFKDLAGQANPVAGALENVIDRVKTLAGGFGALGPVAGTVAIALAGITAAAAAVGVAVGAIGVTLYNWTRGAADAGDELNTLSNKFGMTAEAISEFQFIGKQADVSLEAITGSIFKLGQHMAEGGKKIQGAAKDIGSSLTELRGMKQDDAFRFIIERLGEVPDAGKRAALGVAFFGKQFKEISQLTREDMKALAQQARDAGAVMSQEFAVAGDRFNDSLGAIGAAIEGVKMRIGQVLLPAAIALVETFQKHLVAALQKAGKSTVDFADTLSKVSVTIAQSLAAVVQVGAHVTSWLAEFFAGNFLKHLALVDKILAIGEALLAVGKVASQFNPVLSTLFAKAEADFAGARKAILDLGSGVVTVAGNIAKYADATAKAAAETRRELPAAVAQVRKEIKEQADAARTAIDANTSFGEALGDVEGGADRAAEGLRKLKQETRETSGDLLAAGARLDDFAARFRSLEEQMDSFNQSIPQSGFLDVFKPIEGFNGATEVAITNAELLEQAFRDLGITSQAELQKTADNARLAYETIREQLGETHADTIAAFKKWQEASAAASGQVRIDWLETFAGIQDAMMWFADVSISFAQRAANAVVGIFASVGDVVMGQVQKVGDFIGKKFSGLFGATGLGGMLGGMLGNILSGGIQAIAGWAINKAAEWIGNLIYKPSMRANDDRDVAMTEIASRYGGTGRSGTGAGTDFAIVAARLQEATGSNALFERFLKADTPERFAQALREVEAALEAYEKRLEKATDAEREQAKAIEETKNAQQEKIASLREEMKTLSDELAHWDASEAPEEVMGVMERQARDRIAAEQARIQAAIVEQQRLMAEAVEGISETADESRVAITDGYRAGFENARIVAEQFADRLDGLFGDLTYKVNFELGDMPVPGMPVVPAARGFHRDVDSPTLILAGEAGRERVDITPSGGAPSPSSVNITIQAWDGNDVRRVLQSRDFTEALAGIVTQNPGDIRTKLQFGLGVR